MVFIIILLSLIVLQGVPLTIYIFQFVYYLFCFAMLALGVSWLVSSLNVFIRDVGQVITLLLQVGFWGTPIFWDINMFSEPIQKWLKLNPFFYIVQGYRDSFIGGVPFWQHGAYTLYFWSITGAVAARRSLCLQKAAASVLGRALRGSAMGNDIAISIDNISKEYFLYKKPHHRVIEIFHPLEKAVPQIFYRPVETFPFRSPGGSRSVSSAATAPANRPCCRLSAATCRRLSGSIGVKGRISALLELGAGFNPEFTGRENVYLNTAILGLSREETEARFGQIVDFADIGDFIDRPVKTYSSGMYVRLAFATAISVDPEILVIDEALAVGDIFFQQKCVEHMKQVMQTARFCWSVTICIRFPTCATGSSCSKKEESSTRASLPRECPNTPN